MTIEENISQKQQLVIVGCGFSGMITALALAFGGIKTTIIEHKSTTSPRFIDDIRTTALTQHSVAFLARIKLWEELCKECGEISDIYVLDNKHPSMLHFSALAIQDLSLNKPLASCMGYIVKNADFKKFLLKKVNENNLITLIDNCEYQRVEASDKTTLLHLNDGKIITTPLLIVCDGYNSKARRYYFSSRIDKYYQQHAMTFMVNHAKPHQGTAVEHFMSGGPFAILPLKDPYSSSVVWTTNEERAEMLINLPTEEFEYLVQRDFGDFLGDIKLASKISSFRLKAYVTQRYFYKRIMLIADTAHIIHPLAGQGLNQGIKDIAAFVQLVQNQPISEESLKEYENLRQEDNMAMYFITDNLNRIFSNYSKTLGILRPMGLRLIEKFPPLKNILVKYAVGER